MSSNQTDFDVAILGAGISGPILGAVLANQGVRVLLVEEGSHPKFAIGESTIPGTSLMLRIIATRYRIPELLDLTSFYRMRKHIGSSCGQKRNFGFVFHREGQPQRPNEFTQVIIPELPFGPESHMYRQDVDAYLLFVAMRYGVTVRQRTSISNVHIDESGVKLEGSRGEKFTARYVVDCGGLRAPLASQFNLRDAQPRYRTHSRSMFTHMLQLKPYDDVSALEGKRWKWHEGTLHHIFDGGWMWVIPFNNYEGATNPLVSVGLQLDPRKYPKNPNLTPQQEFDQFLQRFPSIARQFEGAIPAREWVSADRLQYSSRKCVGYRYCLMLHAAGFIDPLFSRGLENTSVTIHALADRLLQALRDDDFSEQRFEYIERLQQSLLDVNDRLVSSCYTAFSDFRLWNAFHRVWAAGAQMGALRLLRAYLKFQETKDVSYFKALDEDVPYLGLLAANLEPYHKLFNAAVAEMDKVAAGTDSAAAVTNRLERMMEESEHFGPLFKLGFGISGVTEPIRHSKYNLSAPMKMARWSRTKAPENLKSLYFDFEMSTLWTQIGKYVQDRL